MMANARAERLLKIPVEPSPELLIPGAAAQTRVVSIAGIRLGSWESARAFKGIVCDDISEFESYMPSQPVQSLWVMCGTWENARQFGGLARYRAVSEAQISAFSAPPGEIRARVSVKSEPCWINEFGVQ